MLWNDKKEFLILETLWEYQGKNYWDHQQNWHDWGKFEIPLYKYLNIWLCEIKTPDIM